jgi:hypothetical protein
VSGEELPSTLKRFLLGDIAWWEGARQHSI